MNFLFYRPQPHKTQMLQGYANKAERKRSQSVLPTPKPALSADGVKTAAARRTCAQKIQRTPQVNAERATSCVAAAAAALTLLNHASGAGNKRKGRRLAEQERGHRCRSREACALARENRDKNAFFIWTNGRGRRARCAEGL